MSIGIIELSIKCGAAASRVAMQANYPPSHPNTPWQSVEIKTSGRTSSEMVSFAMMHNWNLLSWVVMVNA